MIPRFYKWLESGSFCWFLIPIGTWLFSSETKTSLWPLGSDLAWPGLAILGLILSWQSNDDHKLLAMLTSSQPLPSYSRICNLQTRDTKVLEGRLQIASNGFTQWSQCDLWILLLRVRWLVELSERSHLTGERRPREAPLREGRCREV